MNREFDVVCFGEVLWDVFPDKAVIGGAPLNVALRANSFGLKTAMISKIGDDAYGRGILEFLKDRQLTEKYIQTDKDLGTGIVKVILDKSGTASYEIVAPVAWDAIEVSEHNKALIFNTNVLVFGSLVCRGEKSRSTLQALLPLANFRVFDVNLRPPDYELPLLIELMKSSDMVKMNEEELQEISNYLGLDLPNERESLRSISEFTKTPIICITKGEKGAILLHDGNFYEQKGFHVKVVDTVGAGDSFLATLITELIIKKNKPQDALKRACAIGSLVASKKGANPQIEEIEITTIQKD